MKEKHWLKNLYYPCLCKVLISVFTICFILPGDAQIAPVVKTKYGQLRGTLMKVEGIDIGVAAYLGVPYATPPVGVNRFSPTRTLSQWVGVREARIFGAACPQRLPDIRNETAALKVMSRAKFEYLKKAVPILRQQSEDCLYLNIYVPQPGKIVVELRGFVIILIIGIIEVEEHIISEN